MYANITAPLRKGRNRRALSAALLSAGILLLLVLLLTAPARYAQACTRGIALWAKTVLPTLFPFLVLTGILTKLGAVRKLSERLSPLTGVFGLPGCAAYCLLLSLLSGYPVGSRTVAMLHQGGAIDRRQAARMSVLCSTSGPMFLLGSVGGILFKSAAAGMILLTAHILAVVGVSLLLALPRRGRQSAAAPVPPPAAAKYADGILARSMQESVVAILCVGGSIALFSVLAQALTDLRVLSAPSALFALLLSPFGSGSAAEGLAVGLLEATQGCAAIAASGAPLALPLCAFLVTFGGGSILAQQLAFLSAAGVRAGAFIGVKMLQGIAAFLLCLVLCLL